jgi:hypothetical protein
MVVKFERTGQLLEFTVDMLEYVLIENKFGRLFLYGFDQLLFCHVAYLLHLLSPWLETEEAPKRFFRLVWIGLLAVLDA